MTQSILVVETAGISPERTFTLRPELCAFVYAVDDKYPIPSDVKDAKTIKDLLRSGWKLVASPAVSYATTRWYFTKEYEPYDPSM